MPSRRMRSEGATHREMGSMSKKKSSRIRWQPVLDRGRKIVSGYDTGVTLRQAFYRLVVSKALPDTLYAYQRLSQTTAEARREGNFPELIDTTRAIARPQSFKSPQEAQDWLRSIYRRERTEHQASAIYIGVEKRAMVAQFEAWFE